MIRKPKMICVAGLVASLVSQAVAVNLLPGGLVPLPGTTSAARPELAGVVLEDTIRPFAIDLGGGLSITGTVQDRVVRSDTDGTLDFYYRIANDANSQGSISFVARRFYLGYATDVDWRIDGLGAIDPNLANRSANEQVVGFNFSEVNLIDPGEESRFFFIKTDATMYDENGIAQLFGIPVTGGESTSIFFDTFQPVPVPEPATSMLLGLGLVGMGFGLRRLKA